MWTEKAIVTETVLWGSSQAEEIMRNNGIIFAQVSEVQRFLKSVAADGGIKCNAQSFNYLHILKFSANLIAIQWVNSIRL